MQAEYRHLDIQAEFAEGGAGLICTGNIPIDRNYLERQGNAILDRRNPWDAVKAFRPCIAAAKSRGALFLAQLQHPGRQSPESLSRTPVSASDVQLYPCMDKTYAKPRALTVREIKDVVASYVWAAEKLYEAGADGVLVSRRAMTLHQRLAVLTQPGNSSMLVTATSSPNSSRH